MMMKKIVLGSVVMSSILLAGCSSHKAERLDQLSTDVQVINEKVNYLQNDVAQIKQDADVARGEAARANQRLDNQVTMYRK